MQNLTMFIPGQLRCGCPNVHMPVLLEVTVENDADIPVSNSISFLCLVHVQHAMGHAQSSAADGKDAVESPYLGPAT
jgi:hypothetical protein